MRKLTLGAIALAASTMIGSTASHATFTVDVFSVPSVANLHNVALTNPPIATFTTNAINFASPPGLNTIGGFTGSCPACGVLNLDTGEAGMSLQNTVFRFQDLSATAPLGNVGGNVGGVPTGLPPTVVTAGSVAIAHDDGAVLAKTILAQVPAVGDLNIIIDSAAATSPRIDGPVTFIPNPGPVTLFYGEGFGLPAVLQTNLVNAPVPEPASLALLGSALVGFGVIMRRRRKTG